MKSLKSYVGGFILYCTLCASQSFSLPIYHDPVTGYDWMQPSIYYKPNYPDYYQISWGEANNMCPSAVCSGTYHGINFDGWHWATSYQVAELFTNLLGPSNDGAPLYNKDFSTPYTVMTIFDTILSPSESGGWGSTSDRYGIWFMLSGYTSNRSLTGIPPRPETGDFIGVMTASMSAIAVYNVDSVTGIQLLESGSSSAWVGDPATDDGLPESQQLPGIGAWFVRTSNTSNNQLPEPASLVLVCCGLALLSIMRRQVTK